MRRIVYGAPLARAIGHAWTHRFGVRACQKLRWPSSREEQSRPNVAVACRVIPTIPIAATSRLTLMVSWWAAFTFQTAIPRQGQNSITSFGGSSG